jgi:thiol-disulfide isomerase/thioredoxin
VKDASVRFITPRTWLFGLACLAFLAGAAPPAGDDPDAHRLLDEVAKAYRALDAYADRGELVIAMTIDGREEKQSIPMHVALARPNRLSVELGHVRVVCDGKTITTAVGPFKKYTAAPAPKTITLETFREGPGGAMLFGGPADPAVLVLTTLLAGDDAAKVLPEELGGTLKAAPDRDVAGAKHRTLRIDRQEGPDVLMVVNPDSKLLSGIELVVDPAELAKSTAEGQSIKVERFGWSPGAVSTEPPKPATFTYEPPKGFTKVESFAKAVGDAGQAESKHRVNDLVGKPAPEFTLSVLDAGGKFRHVSRADLAGKVVVLDFWATWCGPCLAELPEVQKLVELYSKSKKDVVIIAVSEDDRPSEIGAVRKLVESTLERKHLALEGQSAGKVALDPSQTVGESFQVESLPTVVILDPKGVVQSAHIGFSPDVLETLAKEIDTLLGGGSLVKGK